MNAPHFSHPFRLCVFSTPCLRRLPFQPPPPLLLALSSCFFCPIKDTCKQMYNCNIFLPTRGATGHGRKQWRQHVYVYRRWVWVEPEGHVWLVTVQSTGQLVLAAGAVEAIPETAGGITKQPPARIKIAAHRRGVEQARGSIQLKAVQVIWCRGWPCARRTHHSSPCTAASCRRWPLLTRVAL